MPQLLRAASAAALLGALAAPALALTAQEVWDDWKAQMAPYGQANVTIGSEDYAGGVLTVTDFAFGTSDETGGFSATIPQITLTENADGTVAVAMSESFPLTIDTPADPATGSGPTQIVLNVVQSGATTTVSGELGALTYDVAADSYGVELASVTEAGAARDASGSLTLNDLSGSYTSTGTGPRTIDYDLSAASVDMALDIADPDTGGAFTLTGSVTDLATQASMALPDAAASTPETILADGLAMTGGYTFGEASYQFEARDPESGPVSGTVTMAGGTLDAAVSADALAYDSSVDQVALDVTGAAMPFPVRATLAQYGVSLLVPLRPAGGPSDWALGLDLSDLAINDEVWGMIDPGGQLPRDPATVRLDLTGTATLTQDLTTPEGQAAMEAGAAPGTLDSMTINDLTVSIGGASVTGTGDLTFDNTDLVTFQGMPRPTGTVDLQATGVSALLDTLVAMGLLPPDQAMGARMMMGVLFVQSGDDQMTSRIEFTPDGQLLANGQRLQ